MIKPPKQSDKTLKLPSFVDLPVLTETQVTDTIMLPVLTEALAPGQPAARQAAAPLSEAQCRQIAEQIAPQLEALLREKLAARLGPIWTEIWRETQAELPRLIRAELEKPAPRSRK
jgi:hypothetical protein